ncbi:MAG: hypothetical protein FD124_731 [Alphaproteobacteria bacterium]|nr:MAG: hypothetical protein FD160_910 [Caulobacteraceae bacterium]TPW07994.1 MAG: hypothetical protein FD124_731 [Alphaproteobacteria bacterium]
MRLLARMGWGGERWGNARNLSPYFSLARLREGNSRHTARKSAFSPGASTTHVSAPP